MQFHQYTSAFGRELHGIAHEVADHFLHVVRNEGGHDTSLIGLEGYIYALASRHFPQRLHDHAHHAGDVPLPQGLFSDGRLHLGDIKHLVH